MTAHISPVTEGHQASDPLGSLWRAAQAFRLVTLLYAVMIQATYHGEYTRPLLAWALIALQCIWSGVAGSLLVWRPVARPAIVAGDQLVAIGLMYATWWVAPQSWWDHNQSLPTTIWVCNAIVSAGILWRWQGGLLSGLAISLVSLHVGNDLSWMWRSPTIPVLCSVGLSVGAASDTVRSGAARLERAARLEASARERDRLSREVHDGVLQVLALIARRGREIGGETAELADLATQQERALRALIANHTGGSLATQPPEPTDLRAAMSHEFEQSATVSAAGEVHADPHVVSEIVAACRQAIENTREHAGEGARAFVLIEPDGDRVLVTVRDDGVGMPTEREGEAAADGRLGIRASIRGRIDELGGTAHLFTAPGEGVEWEFDVPVHPPG